MGVSQPSSLAQVYSKFHGQYEPDNRAVRWAHGLIKHQLLGGLHQLIPVRTNNLLERVWKTLKHARGRGTSSAAR